ncbi:H-NS family nucleoid-associated regulatory protein [Burkholderia territorii]|uniref:H-NS histone family protein n=1 Tax=Burkholderia territorii TaxID=1503055 RepID=UPI001E415B9C|nr:H-NS histone family protein [Burkholderia territorii]
MAMKTYSELVSEFEKLKKDIESARDLEARLIAEKVLSILRENGIDIQKIFGVNILDSNLKKKNSVQPKYWNPETGATWSGRGKRPRWLVGQDLAKFRIPASPPDDGEA